MFYYSFLSGGIMFACLVASLYFFRFWRASNDRFFLYFAVSFVAFGVERLALAINGDPNSESTSMLYVIRLTGFLIILWAIVDKNMRKAA